MSIETTLKQIDRMEEILLELLDCGYADLSMVYDSKYPMSDIIEYAKGFTDSPKLNDLIYAILQMGIDDMAHYIENETECIVEGLNDDDYNAMVGITFNPHEDIEIFINFLDSHVWFVDGMMENYKKYFPQAIEKFEEMTGVSLT